MGHLGDEDVNIFFGNSFATFCLGYEQEQTLPPSPDEQHVLEHGHLRLLGSEQNNYLHDATLVGARATRLFIEANGWRHCH